MNTDGSKREELIWVPNALVPHVREEVRQNRLIDMELLPGPVKGRQHVRVPAGLSQGIRDQIGSWRTQARRKS